MSRDQEKKTKKFHKAKRYLLLRIDGHTLRRPMSRITQTTFVWT